uniref:ATP synthase F0 subunit 8 n=1 Tax=Rhopalopsole subnigra TaxID=3040649 RepID=UPI002551EFCE|nr:ATP synthase F0 subunit 8 [Rhopalopsole subnigra]WGC89472.1 ATP synthase F0 subunit 8 [Rhopalopsole subnigra]
MPQMAPISWLTLFIMFSLILLIFNFVNYFIFLPTAPKSSHTQILSPTMNWKW